MKGKLIMYVLLMSLLTLGLVQAGSITAPANGAEICGTYSFVYTSTLSDTTNVTLWRSTLGNGSLPWVNVASVGNTTANQSSFTVSYNTAGVTDGVNYKWNLTATDGSGFQSGYVNNSNVDNTAPTISWAAANTPDSSTAGVKSENFVVSVTSDENLVNPTVSVGGKLFSLSGSGVAWSKSFVDNEVAEGSFRYTVTGVDNTTCASSTSVTRWVLIDNGRNLGGVQAVIATQTEGGEPQSNPLVIGGLLVAGYFILRGRKRRR